MQYYCISIYSDKFMRLLSLSTFLLISACSTVSEVKTQIAKLPNEIVYKLPTRQGNVIEQKSVDQLQIGMTRDQVKYLMGTPIAANPFREDRWDYFGYYKSPRGEISHRNVTLFFDGSKLARMEGVKLASLDQSNAKALDDPDFGAIESSKKKLENVDHARDENPAGQPSDANVPSPEGSNIPSVIH